MRVRLSAKVNCELTGAKRVREILWVLVLGFGFCEKVNNNI